MHLRFAEPLGDADKGRVFDTLFDSRSRPTAAETDTMMFSCKLTEVEHVSVVRYTFFARRSVIFYAKVVHCSAHSD